MDIKPQPGPQTDFLSSPCDIVFYGGSAGGGKTCALLMEPLRHMHIPKFEGIIFRITEADIRKPGSLLSSSTEMYGGLAGGRLKPIDWTFPSGARVTLSHLQYEKTVLSYQGASIPYIGFDELTHFSYYQFFYMLSRNRSTCGVRPYLRGTCNPDPDSWVRDFIDWWIDDGTGLIIPERSGVVRYIARDVDKIVWGDTEKELSDVYGADAVKSFTFIRAELSDNQILMDKDPGYIASLKLMPYVQRQQLLHGNWNIKPAAGLYFKREHVGFVDKVPVRLKKVIRYWDRASTPKNEKNNPDWTRGVKMAVGDDRRFYVLGMDSIRGAPYDVEKLIMACAEQDGKEVGVYLEQDPGQAGVADIANYVRMLAGYNVRKNRVSKDKITRALGYSAQWEAGNVVLLRGHWNDEFIQEHEVFPPDKNQHDDVVDASSGAFNMLTSATAILDMPDPGSVTKRSNYTGF